MGSRKLCSLAAIFFFFFLFSFVKTGISPWLLAGDYQEWVEVVLEMSLDSLSETWSVIGLAVSCQRMLLHIFKGWLHALSECEDSEVNKDALIFLSQRWTVAMYCNVTTSLCMWGVDLNGLKSHITNNLSLLELQRNDILYEWDKMLEFLHGTEEGLWNRFMGILPCHSYLYYALACFLVLSLLRILLSMWA